ncbi:MAG TPA: hypothetical protein VIR60_00075 [Gammaproteobacteria bacterium]
MIRTCARLVVLVAALSAGAHAQADDLGRLFTTPGERARIDALRAGRVVTDDADQPQTVIADRIILNGTLTGSDGKRLAWINGAAVDAARDPNVTLLRDGEVRLHLRDGALARDLKPGQGVDTASGKVFENYQRPVAPASIAPVAEVQQPSMPSLPAGTTAVDAAPAAAAEDSGAASKADPKPATSPSNKARQP